MPLPFPLGKSLSPSGPSASFRLPRSYAMSPTGTSLPSVSSLSSQPSNTQPSFNMSTSATDPSQMIGQILSIMMLMMQIMMQLLGSMMGGMPTSPTGGGGGEPPTSGMPPDEGGYGAPPTGGEIPTGEATAPESPTAPPTTGGAPDAPPTGGEASPTPMAPPGGSVDIPNSSSLPSIKGTKVATHDPNTLNVLKPDIEAASSATGVPACLIAAVIWNESRGDTNLLSGNHDAINTQNPNGKQDRGFMQVNDDTADSLRKKYPQEIAKARAIGPNAENIMLGALYLKDQKACFGSWEYALRAYNSGPNGIVQGDPEAIKGTGTKGYPSNVLSYMQDIRKGLPLSDVKPTSSPSG